MLASFPLVTSLALGAAVSTSDLGVVVTGNTAAAVTIVDACPRAVKVAAPLAGPVAASLLAAYHQQCTGAPRGIFELPAFSRSIFVDTVEAGAGDADQYWNLVCGSIAGPCVIGSLVGSLDAADVQWLTGPPNFFSAVDPGALGQASYAQGFLRRLAARVLAEATFRGAPSLHLLLPPFAGSSTTGFCSALQAAQLGDPGVGWTFRALASASLLQSEAQESGVFGFRAIRSACGVSAPLFVELSATGGWGLSSNARTPDQVLDWLRFVDLALDATGDADVHTAGAVLLRVFGGAGIDDLDPLVAVLATHLATPAPPPDGDGGGSTGGIGPIIAPGASGGVAVGPADRGACGNPGGGLALLAIPAVLWRLRSRR